MTKTIFKLLPWIVVAVLAVMVFYLYKNPLAVEQKTETKHQSVLQKIENLGKLELVKYTFRDVMEHKNVKKIMGFETSSKVLLIIGAEAVGCIDLTKVSGADVKESKDTILISLPAPEICYTKINHKDSKVYQTNMTLFDSEGKLIDGAYKEAEKYITDQISKTDIMERSKENAKKLLVPMFENISDKKVIVSFK